MSAAKQRPCPACGETIELSVQGPAACPHCGWFRRGDTTVVAIPMDGRRHVYRLPDALQAVQALMDLGYDGSGIVPPNRSAAVRTRALIMAVGPFTEGGPSRITLTASIKGGLTVTFFVGEMHVVVACMNNGRTLFVLCESKDSEPHAEDIPLEEAIERTRALVVGCGHDEATPQPLRLDAAAY